MVKAILSEFSFSHEVHRQPLQEPTNEYLEENSRRWQPYQTVIVMEIDDMNKMKMAIYVKHTINFYNVAKRMSRRYDLIFHVNEFFEELKIQYQLLPQRIHLSYAGLIDEKASPLPVRQWAH
ncbi:hypothetical protein GH714_038535 [Hevea brasiliensis]|uniref:Uncharacterized protein n=1 Tax=Hevea brasiliensis TaxID=3981 RepID=A0A6A6KFT7_HEVBR|nr:hypothetical protein GH714_038535 [Hevea brasiliensis]